MIKTEAGTGLTIESPYLIGGTLSTERLIDLEPTPSGVGQYKVTRPYSTDPNGKVDAAIFANANVLSLEVAWPEITAANGNGISSAAGRTEVFGGKITTTGVALAFPQSGTTAVVTGTEVKSSGGQAIQSSAHFYGSNVIAHDSGKDGIDLRSPGNSITGGTIYNNGQLGTAFATCGICIHFTGRTNTTITNVDVYDHQGTVTQTSGIFEDSQFSPDYTTLIGNRVQNGAGITQYSLVGNHDLISSDPDSVAPAVSSVTAGASVWTYTNTDKRNEFMQMQAVNGASAWTCNGVASYTLTVGISCYLPSGTTMLVTWATTSPTFWKQQQN